MATNKSTTSLKTSIATAIVAVSLLSLILSVTFTSYFLYKNDKREASYLVTKFADIVAYNAIVPVIFDQREDLDGEDNGFFNTLKDIKEISYVHIYHYPEGDDELAFFASYNGQMEIGKGIRPKLTPQIDRLNELRRPLFSEDYVELAIPIVDTSTFELGQRPLGYVYIQVLLDKFRQNLDNMIKFNVLIAFIVAFAAFGFSRLIQNRIVLPLNVFVKEIQHIANTNAFDQKVQTPNFSELKTVADSVNGLLNKINRTIHQYNQAEKEVTELNQNLEEKVVSRTQALRDSNQELLDALEQVHQYQSQVIQSEKMASLGQMVAGVAHEVNTPIGLGVTASTMLSDKIEEIDAELQSQTLSAKKLQRFLTESRENTQIIYRNLSRAADLISSFKQVAVDQTADTIRQIEVESFLNEVLISMNPTLKKCDHTIQIHCDPKLQLKTKPGPINQIIINLIMNSIIHAFPDQKHGKIEIKVEYANNKCVITYSDDGCGIEEKIKQKIFDPFVTTKRGEGGSGLGMHLVYNLVTQALNGHITVQSRLGDGAVFTIDFPAVQVL